MNVVYELALRDLIRSKKAIFAAGVSLLPAILMLLAVIETASFDSPWSTMTTYGLLTVGLLGTIPLTCLILTGGLLADEAEDRTLSYLLVRPISRQTLYLQRGLAVLTVALALVMFQVLSVWVIDALYFATSRHEPINGWNAGAVLGLSLPVAVFVGLLASVFYTATFGAISVLVPRYHFFANLGFLVLWEFGVGLFPSPAAWLTGNHALRAIVSAALPLDFEMTAVSGAWNWFGVLAAVGLCMVWIAAGLRIVRERDFHVTSAAT